MQNRAHSTRAAQGRREDRAQRAHRAAQGRRQRRCDCLALWAVGLCCGAVVLWGAMHGTAEPATVWGCAAVSAALQAVALWGLWVE